MTLRDWLTFRFPTPVLLEAETSSAEFIAELATLTAPRFSTSKMDRKKPLRGVLGENSGVLRWPINEYRFVSPRSLYFKLTQVGAITVLEGEFVVWLVFRVVVMGWLCLGILAWAVAIIQEIVRHHATWPMIRQGLFASLIGILIAYGYTGLCIFAGRRRERDVVRVLEAVAKGPAAAQIVRDLLIR